MSLQPILNFLINDVCQRLQIMGTRDKVIGKSIGKSTEKFITCLLLLCQVHLHLDCFKWHRWDTTDKGRVPLDSQSKAAADKTGTQNT